MKPQGHPPPQVDHEGECEMPAYCQNCSDVYKPVCGVDKLTYVNQCVAECSRATVIKSGVCSKTLIIKPRWTSMGAR